MSSLWEIEDLMFSRAAHMCSNKGSWKPKGSPQVLNFTYAIPRQGHSKLHISTSLAIVDNNMDGHPIGHHHAN